MWPAITASWFSNSDYPAALDVFTSDEQTLSQMMIGYWTRFAKNGNPNSAGTPRWAPYSPAKDRRLSLVPSGGPVTESGFATDHQCSFWDLL